MLSAPSRHDPDSADEDREKQLPIDDAVRIRACQRTSKLQHLRRWKSCRPLVVPPRQSWFGSLESAERAVTSLDDVTGARRDIWTLDLTAGTLTPLTTTGTARNPMWSADGRRILYASTHGGRAEFWWQPADGSGSPQKAVTPRHNPWFADLSPDDRHVVFNAIASVNFDLESVSLDSTREARELFAGRYVDDFDVSRDGTRFLMIAQESSDMGLVVIPNWRTELKRLTAAPTGRAADAAAPSSPTSSPR